MFANPSLTTRIIIGEVIGLVFGLAGFILLPFFYPEAGWLLRWGILLWYTTLGAIIGVLGVYTRHAILNFPMPWWFRAPVLVYSRGRRHRARYRLRCHPLRWGGQGGSRGRVDRPWSTRHQCLLAVTAREEFRSNKRPFRQVHRVSPGRQSVPVTCRCDAKDRSLATGLQSSSATRPSVYF